MGDRAGDNSQVLGLGEALGWPLVRKHFVYTRFETVVNLPLGAHLMGVVRNRSSKLEAPWPDLVISAGRKNEPIARYIRKKADKPPGTTERKAKRSPIRVHITPACISRVSGCLPRGSIPVTVTCTMEGGAW